ncbi:MAG: flagellar filament capping protein FliD [Lachnospiraceae bacterium]|nr:flagellar filament capping protein FliD [Lachnospiraceae bacterium]
MSNRLRMTGINSGMDTQSIVEQLVTAKSSKKEKLKKQQTKLSWKQDAWSSLNSKLYSLYNEQFGNLRLQGTFTAKKASISDSNVATVSADTKAVSGSQQLVVRQLAKQAYITGAKLEDVKYTAEEQTSLGQILQKKINDEMDRRTKAGEFTRIDDGGIMDNNKIGTVVRADAYDELEAMWGGESQKFSVRADGDSEFKEVELKADMHMKDVAAAFAKAGLKASFDEGTGRFYLSSLKEGSEGQFEIKTIGGLNALGTDEEAEGEIKNAKANSGNWLEVLGLTTATKATSDNPNGGSFINAQDAVIELNGARYTNSNNTFSINGLNITATSESEKDESGNYKATTLTVSNDIDTVYNSIKEFFKKYNEIINEMDKLFNADSDKDYEPLTEDEKDAMSEDEIKEWEQKIKDALLRRDDNLRTVINTLKDGMSKQFTIGENTYSLSTFGINTLSYFEADENERGAYHIDGDSDDEKTKGNSDKLKEALSNNLEDVTEFFNQLAQGVYESLGKQMTRVEGTRSFQKLYDDKQLQSDYDKLTKELKEEEDYLSDYEDKWYDKFAAMEKAMAKVNSKSDALAGLFGTG